MSYDFRIGDYEGNYTFNLAPLFYDVMPGGLPDLNGKTGSKAAITLEHGIALAKSWSAEKLTAYDAENGWGTASGALNTLEEFRRACLRHPRKKVAIYY